VFHGKEVNHVERLSLLLGHSRYARVMRREVCSGKGAARELEAGTMAFEFVKDRTGTVFAFPEPACLLSKGSLSVCMQMRGCDILVKRPVVLR
jgi:hypothetical protein